MFKSCPKKSLFQGNIIFSIESENIFRQLKKHKYTLSIVFLLNFLNFFSLIQPSISANSTYHQTDTPDLKEFV